MKTAVKVFFVVFALLVGVFAIATEIVIAFKYNPFLGLGLLIFVLAVEAAILNYFMPLFGEGS